MKEKLASPEVHAHYDPKRQTVIAANASSTGLGAVLLQTQDNGQRRPICYISRSLSDAERNYAVIEKESTRLNLGVRTPRRVCTSTQVYPGNRPQAACSTPHHNELFQDAPLASANAALEPEHQFGCQGYPQPLKTWSNYALHMQRNCQNRRSP